MKILTGTRAAAALAQSLDKLAVNHLLAAGLVLEWGAPYAPPWHASAAHQLATIRHFRKALGDRLNTATLLLPDDGSLVLVADIIRNSAYRDAISCFEKTIEKYNLSIAEATFTPHDLSIGWTDFTAACARISARVQRPTVFIPQHPAVALPTTPQIPLEEYKTILEDLFVQQLIQPVTPSVPQVSKIPQSRIRTASTGSSKPTALLIEDDAAVRMLAAQLLRAGGLHVITASSGAEALRQYLVQPPQLVLLDVGLPDISGLEILDILHRHVPQLYAVMFTASAAPATVASARQNQVRDYIVKPFNQQRIQDCISRFRKNAAA